MRSAPMALALAVLGLACGGSCGSGSAGPAGDDGGTGPDTTTGDAPTADSPTPTPDAPSDGASDGPAPPACGTSAWSTYGHDAARTGASDGCIKPPLKTAWRYVPAPPSGRTTNGVHVAVADAMGVYLNWMATDPPYTGTTAADRVSPAGQRVWTWDSGTDTNQGNWPLLANGALVLDDDGVYWLDAATGTKKSTTGVDWWGSLLADNARFYAVNDWHVDGPGVLIQAFDLTFKKVWAANEYAGARLDPTESALGTALDGGVVYYAASYEGMSVPLASGLYAFDAATGMVKWSVKSTPAGAISVAAGTVFMIEGTSTNPATVVARRTADGSMIWSTPLTGLGSQAPVLVDGVAIVATSNDIEALDQRTGKVSWKAAVAGASTTSFLGFGVPGQKTALAASAAGHVLIAVTSNQNVHLVDTRTGSETYKAKIDKLQGAPENPIVVGGRLYVIDSMSALVAIDGS